MSALEAWPDQTERTALATAHVVVLPWDTPAATVRLLGDLAALVAPGSVLYTAEPITPEVP